MDPIILCIIPARSGSKGIINKNIKNYKGKPLLAWSIEHALRCHYKMRIIVSTDSEEYAEISRKYGAETPFLRPSNISEDNSTSLECIQHCVEWLNLSENYKPDIILLLQPTTPNRDINDINKCLKLFIESRFQYDSLYSITKVKQSPFKMLYFENEICKPLFKEINGISEPYNKPRQLLPDAFIGNGSLFIFNTDNIFNNTIWGNKMLPYIMESYNDIDSIEDWV